MAENLAPEEFEKVQLILWVKIPIADCYVVAESFAPDAAAAVQSMAQ